ncbi:MAG TPA: SHOCT domain-containing protein [Anaerolineales bacterium]|nr:SHOCT domain-containing protein [Anaerolineales bacterium]
MSRTAWAIVIALAVILVVAFGVSMVLPQCLGGQYGYGYGGMMGPWMMGGIGIFGMLGGVLLLVLLVGGGAWLFQAATRAGGAHPAGLASETPLEILKRRYAKGEITKDQYEAMRRDLGS